jgi:uncharacterized membrane protein
MNTSPLNRHVTIPVLRRLLAAGELKPQEELAMEQQVRRDLPWATWLDRGLLALGAVLVLAGIGYFFAHNWDHLTNSDKLGLAGGSVLLALAGGTWAGFDRFLGKILLLAASALVGVFLGVFGQVYQTGADSYELFVAWALLILPWVLLGRFMPLWLCWLALFNLAFYFYWPVRHFLFLDDPEEFFRQEMIGLFLLNGAALLVLEFAGCWPITWLERGWSALIVLLAALVPASIETLVEIVEGWESRPESCLTVCAIYAVTVILLALYYSRPRYSLPALSIVTLGACTVLTVLAVRFLTGNFDHLDAGVLLICGMAVLLIFGGGVFFLHHQRQVHQEPK